MTCAVIKFVKDLLHALNHVKEKHLVDIILYYIILMKD